MTALVSASGAPPSTFPVSFTINAAPPLTSLTPRSFPTSLESIGLLSSSSMHNFASQQYHNDMFGSPLMRAASAAASFDAGRRGARFTSQLPSHLRGPLMEDVAFKQLTAPGVVSMRRASNEIMFLIDNILLPYFIAVPVNRGGDNSEKAAAALCEGLEKSVRSHGHGLCVLGYLTCEYDGSEDAIRFALSKHLGGRGIGQNQKKQTAKKNSEELLATPFTSDATPDLSSASGEQEKQRKYLFSSPTSASPASPPIAPTTITHVVDADVAFLDPKYATMTTAAATSKRHSHSLAMCIVSLSSLGCINCWSVRPGTPEEREVGDFFVIENCCSQRRRRFPATSDETDDNAEDKDNDDDDGGGVGGALLMSSPGVPVMDGPPGAIALHPSGAAAIASTACGGYFYLVNLGLSSSKDVSKKNKRRRGVITVIRQLQIRTLEPVLGLFWGDAAGKTLNIIHSRMPNTISKLNVRVEPSSSSSPWDLQEHPKSPFLLFQGDAITGLQLLTTTASVPIVLPLPLHRAVRSVSAMVQLSLLHHQQHRRPTTTSTDSSKNNDTAPDDGPVSSSLLLSQLLDKHATDRQQREQDEERAYVEDAVLDSILLVSSRSTSFIFDSTNLRLLHYIEHPTNVPLQQSVLVRALDEDQLVSAAPSSSSDVGGGGGGASAAAGTRGNRANKGYLVALLFIDSTLLVFAVAAHSKFRRMDTRRKNQSKKKPAGSRHQQQQQKDEDADDRDMAAIVTTTRWTHTLVAQESVNPCANLAFLVPSLVPDLRTVFASPLSSNLSARQRHSWFSREGHDTKLLPQRLLSVHMVSSKPRVVQQDVLLFAFNDNDDKSLLKQKQKKKNESAHGKAVTTAGVEDAGAAVLFVTPRNATAPDIPLVPTALLHADGNNPNESATAAAEYFSQFPNAAGALVGGDILHVHISKPSASNSLIGVGHSAQTLPMSPIPGQQPAVAVAPAQQQQRGTTDGNNNNNRAAGSSTAAAAAVLYENYKDFTPMVLVAHANGDVTAGVFGTSIQHTERSLCHQVDRTDALVITGIVPVEKNQLQIVIIGTTKGRVFSWPQTPLNQPQQQQQAYSSSSPTRHQQQWFHPHTTPVVNIGSSMAYDKVLIVTAALDGTAALFNLGRKMELELVSFVETPNYGLRGIAWNSTTEYCFTYSNDGINVWHHPTGKLERTIHVRETTPSFCNNEQQLRRRRSSKKLNRQQGGGELDETADVCDKVEALVSRMCEPSAVQLSAKALSLGVGPFFLGSAGGELPASPPNFTPSAGTSEPSVFASPNTAASTTAAGKTASTQSAAPPVMSYLYDVTYSPLKCTFVLQVHFAHFLDALDQDVVASPSVESTDYCCCSPTTYRVPSLPSVAPSSAAPLALTLTTVTATANDSFGGHSAISEAPIQLSATVRGVLSHVFQAAFSYNRDEITFLREYLSQDPETMEDEPGTPNPQQQQQRQLNRGASTFEEEQVLSLECDAATRIGALLMLDSDPLPETQLETVGGNIVTHYSVGLKDAGVYVMLVSVVHTLQLCAQRTTNVYLGMQCGHCLQHYGNMIVCRVGLQTSWGTRLIEQCIPILTHASASIRFAARFIIDHVIVGFPGAKLAELLGSCEQLAESSNPQEKTVALIVLSLIIIQTRSNDPVTQYAPSQAFIEMVSRLMIDHLLSKTRTELPRSDGSLEVLAEGYDCVFTTPYGTEKLPVVLSHLFSAYAMGPHDGKNYRYNSGARLLTCIAANSPAAFLKLADNIVIGATTFPGVDSKASRIALVYVCIRIVQTAPAIAVRIFNKMLVIIWKIVDPHTPQKELREATLPAVTLFFQNSVRYLPNVALQQASQRLAVGQTDGHVTIYDIKSTAKAEVFKAYDSHAGGVACVAYSNVGQELATLGRDMASVRIWRLGSQGVFSNLLHGYPKFENTFTIPVPPSQRMKQQLDSSLGGLLDWSLVLSQCSLSFLSPHCVQLNTPWHRELQLDMSTGGRR